MPSGSPPISQGATLFTTADQAVVGLDVDLDQHGGAGVVPRAGIGKGLRQRGLGDMGTDVPDFIGLFSLCGRASP